MSKSKEKSDKRLSPVQRALIVGGLAAAGLAGGVHVVSGEIAANQLHDDARALAVPYDNVAVTDVTDHQLNFGKNDKLPGGAPMDMQFGGDTRTDVTVTFKPKVTNEARDVENKYLHDDHIMWAEPTVSASITSPNAKDNKGALPAEVPASIHGLDQNNNGDVDPSEVTNLDLYPRSHDSQGHNLYSEGAKMKVGIQEDVRMPFSDPMQEERGETYAATLTYHDGAWQLDPNAEPQPNYLQHLENQGDETRQVGPDEVIPPHN